MLTLLIACMVHPEAQQRARDEIDLVVGRERLPSFEDRPRLPFVDAMTKEALRWRPLLPLGMSYRDSLKQGIKPIPRFIAIPHVAAEDGFYDGYFIPKGAMFFT